MKRIKQTISILLAVIMTMCILPVAASAETVSGECGLEGDNLTWTFDTETGVLTIDGEGEMDNYSLYNNINKTSAPWWDYYSQITELVIGDGVTSIGNYAFYKCNTLTNLDIPESVKTIGNYAFYDCNNIVDVKFKEKLVSIGTYTFYQCDSIKEVIIPDSVTKIGSYSFACCEKVEKIKLGNGLIEIPTQAFAYCKKLNNIEWGTNLKTISSFAFAYCHQNGGKVGYNCGNILIPRGVERIDRYAFYISESRTNTSSVSIPLSVKYIGEDAFGSIGGEITNVYYEGTIEQWEEIDIYRYGNENLRNATFHFGHSHEYTSEITTEPTCTETGVKTYTCSCGESYTRTLSALGHDIVMDSAVPATCTETGLTQGEHCSRCDYSVPQEETPGLGHDEVEIPAVPATCTSTGLTAGTGCSRCDMIFEQQEVTPMVDHTVETVSAVAPTCTQTGLTEGRICTVCGEVFDGQQEIPALGHTVVTDPAVVATCTTSGLTEGSHCSVCGEVLAEQEYIPATGHTEVYTEYVEPTCTEDGKTVGKVCSVCGEVMIPSVTIPARGHHYTDWITTANPTCTVDGKQIKICACGLFEEQSIPATGHADADGDGVCDNCLCVIDGTQQGGAEEQPKDFVSLLKNFFKALFEMIKRLFK